MGEIEWVKKQMRSVIITSWEGSMYIGSDGTVNASKIDTLRQTILRSIIFLPWQPKTHSTDNYKKTKVSAIFKGDAIQTFTNTARQSQIEPFT